MPITTLSSREFNQHTSRAKRAAKDGPVFIADRGKPVFVLLTIAEYEKLAGKEKNILELLAMPGIADIDFEPPRFGGERPEPVDLS